MGFYFDGSGQRTHRHEPDEFDREDVESLRPSPGKSSRTHGGGDVLGTPGKISLTTRLAQREAPLPTPRAVFERLIRDVELVDASNRPIGEFDGIDMAGRRFVENKSATGIDRFNPSTGRPQQTAAQWARCQITTTTNNRITALAITIPPVPGTGEPDE